MRHRPRRFWLFAALLLGAACSGDEAPTGNTSAPQAAEAYPAPAQPVEASSAAGSTVLTPAGWGPLRIGMTLDEVIAAAGPDSEPEAVGGPEPEQCDQFRPQRAPEGMLVMIEQGWLTRISIVDGAGLHTVHGLRLGAAAEAVKAKLGGTARISPHEYSAPVGEYIDVWTSGKIEEAYVRDPAARGIRYEVGAEGVVEAIHAGGPAIQYVEGCL